MNLIMKQMMSFPIISWKKISFKLRLPKFNFDKVDQANKFREEATNNMLRRSYYI